MGPAYIFWSLFSFYWLTFFWDFYLSLRQYRLIKRTEKRPENVLEIISEEEFLKARLYQLDKMHFGFVTSVISHLEFTTVLLFDLLPWFWALTGNWSRLLWPSSGEIWHSIVFICVSTVIENIISLPFNYYNTFVIEQKHGFNKQTPSFFFADSAKKLVLGMVLTAPIVAAVLWIIEVGGSYFYFYVWAFISLMIFVMMTIYPEFIAPLFDKYVPLPESELKTKIEALAARLEFPLTKLYVVHGSKRSSHSNAYMYGFWKNKRIVLFDTMLNEEMNELLKDQLKDEKKTEEKSSEESEKLAEGEEAKENDEKKEENKLGMKDDEVVAVLGHELGHWKLSHTLRNLIIAEVNILLILMVFAYFYRQQSLYAAFGFTDSKPMLIGLLVILQFVLAPYNELTSIAMSFLSRTFEFGADRFAAELGYASLLCSGLIKLNKDNLALPIDDKLYSMVNHSHPPVPERIEALKKFM